MDAWALAGYGIFLLLAFGWRTLRQWRSTGDTGLRLAARTGSVAWWAKLGFILAILLGFAAPVAGLAGLAPIARLDHDILRGVGAVLAVLGIVLTLVAQLQMGTSWRIGVDPDERTPLVTTGTFARVRNPIFTAMMLAAAGMLLLVGNVVAVVAFIAVLGALELQVRAVEEPHLRDAHGSEYASYAARAGRFIPGLGRSSAQREAVTTK